MYCENISLEYISTTGIAGPDDTSSFHFGSSYIYIYIYQLLNCTPFSIVSLLPFNKGSPEFSLGTA